MLRGACLRPTLRALRSIPRRAVLYRTAPQRHNSPILPPANEELVRLLQANPELAERDDAQAEVRWMWDAANTEAGRTDRTGDRESLLASWVKRRAEGEPLQYILEVTDFGGIDLCCRRPVLIPRAETADVVQRLAELLLERGPAKGLEIIDLCTGSGCIALYLNHMLTSCNASGLDIAEPALRLARENASKMGAGVSFYHHDIWRPWTLRRFHLVVSNPPYIPREDYEGLGKGVKDYEDPRALIGDPSDVPEDWQFGSKMPEIESDGRGLAYYRRIAQLLPDVLLPRDDHKGWRCVPKVAVEVGQGQAEAVEEILMTQSGGTIASTIVWNDKGDRPRMVVGY